LPQVMALGQEER